MIASLFLSEVYLTPAVECCVVSHHDGEPHDDVSGDHGRDSGWDHLGHLIIHCLPTTG